MTARRHAWGCCALLALLFTGCGFALPRQPVPPRDQGAWPIERDRYTRSVKIYDRLDDQVFATVTYQAPSVRTARVERLAVWRGLSTSEREALMATEREEQSKYEDFLLAFYSNDRSANDLDSTKSVWRVSLEVPGGTDLLPVKIEQVRVDATVAQLYPYIGHFDTVYRLRFPRWTGPKSLAEQRFALRIAGALGKVALEYGAAPAGAVTE